MSEATRIRAVARDGMVNVKVLLSHPMETGQRKDSSGRLVPPHYIRNVTATVGNRPVLHAELGPAVASNPYLEFNFKGAGKGDKIAVSWIDSKGDKRTDEATIT